MNHAEMVTFVALNYCACPDESCSVGGTKHELYAGFDLLQTNHPGLCQVSEIALLEHHVQTCAGCC